MKGKLEVTRYNVIEEFISDFEKSEISLDLVVRVISSDKIKSSNNAESMAIDSIDSMNAS